MTGEVFMKKFLVTSILMVILAAVLAACSSNVAPDYDAEEFVEITEGDVPLSSSALIVNVPDFPIPTAAGVNVRRVDNAEIDYSNIRYGYVMARFTGNTTNTVMVLIYGPLNVRYQYFLNTNGDWEVFPLSEGSGEYRVSIHERVDGSRFSTVVRATFTAEMENEFAPFLRPNQFVNFSRESSAVRKAALLVYNSETDLDKVVAVYNFVIENIEYDEYLARNVRSNFIPDLERTMELRMGICFCYASLMTAMLRSQGVPTQLVIGYAGTLRHAWINVHTEEYGWINNVIWFDGFDWHLMDPTFAATGNQSESVMQFIGDGTNYNPTHFH
jgi:hypothetical protein